MALKVKAFIARVICQPVIGNLLAWVFNNRIPSRGFRFLTQNALISPTIKAQLFWRIYESGEIRFVKKYLRKDLDVVELGAGIGVVTCFLRSLVSRNHKIVAVEANPELVPEIKNNLVLNNLWENVTLIHAAVDYLGTTATFTLKDNYLGYLGGKLDQAGPSLIRADVAAITLKTILQANELADYALVTDIEGAEAVMLERDPDQLAACRQIIAELHNTVIDGRPVTIRDMTDDLVSRHGFRIVDQYGPVVVFEKP